jgi:hypothetical protein
LSPIGLNNLKPDMMVKNAYLTDCSVRDGNADKTKTARSPGGLIFGGDRQLQKAETA